MPVASGWRSSDWISPILIWHLRMASPAAGKAAFRGHRLSDPNLGRLP